MRLFVGVSKVLYMMFFALIVGFIIGGYVFSTYSNIEPIKSLREFFVGAVQQTTQTTESRTDSNI